MFFINKNIKVIKAVTEYYGGKNTSLPYNEQDIEKAIEYAQKYKDEYPDDIIEKLSMIKVLLK